MFVLARDRGHLRRRRWFAGVLGREVSGKAAGAGREPAQVYGSTQIELAWTVIPVLIVVVLFLATARVIHAIQDAPEPAAPSTSPSSAINSGGNSGIRSSASSPQTSCTFRQAIPRIPRPPSLKLLSADTDHSFWVPELGGKTDLIPNRVNQMWLDPPRTGIYLGQCAQYCGTQHAKMLLRVSVDRPADFAAWVSAQQQPAVQDARVSAGKRVFETTACINCHAVSGTAANGRFGPDLTHLMSRSTLASGAAGKYAAKICASGSRTRTPLNPGR